MCVVTAAGSAFAQTFTNMATFNGADGTGALALVQGFDGSFYGTTVGGGAHGKGTVFKVTASGALTTLYSFCPLANCTDGSQPQSGLAPAVDGNLYGTTSYGGTYNSGTFFRITPVGNLTTLYNFCLKTYCIDGLHPNAALIQGRDGNFYGTTEFGGTNDYGTVFKVTSHGVFTTLHSFCSAMNCSDGAVPNGPLVQTTDGTFYGTSTGGGGAAFGGTVFRMTSAGKVTTLYSFCSLTNCADGSGPEGQLVRTPEGSLFGTTSARGEFGGGTVFKLAPDGQLTTLYNFCSQPNCPDGVYPYSGLMQATDGNFYGTTYSGGIYAGANDGGTIFKVTLSGVLTTLYSFCSETTCPDGVAPLGLFQGTDGNLYGATEYGGLHKDGTVFRFGVDLQPFLRTFPALGNVGAKITITGSNLSGATRISFGGIPATFTTKSDSQIAATVPPEAKTGEVTLTTAGGVLSSNQPFLVTPQFKTLSPASGPIGTPVTIIGASLTQTLRVTFGGFPAARVVVNSNSQITANVPTGAKTGRIVVTTLGGKTSSDVNFVVTP